MTIPLMILGVLSIVAAGWQTADKGWFAKFAAPYDMPAIVAEFNIEGAGDHLVLHDDHAQAGHETGHETEAVAEEAHGDEHAAAVTHGEEAHGGHHDVAHTAHVRAMIMSITMALLGITLSWWVYHRKKVNTAAIQKKYHRAYTVLQGMYFFDEFYHATVYPFTLWVASVCAAFDRIVIDGIVNGTGYLTRMVAWISGQIDKYLVDGAVNGVATVLQGAGEGFRRIQTGRIQTYLTYVSASVLILVLVYRVL
jgi:NADH-quinone oxidoreductase subunit L